METSNIVDEVRKVLYENHWYDRDELMDLLKRYSDWTQLSLKHIEQEPKWISVEDFILSPINGSCWIYRGDDIRKAYFRNGVFYESQQAYAFEIPVPLIKKVIPITKPSPPQGIDK